MKKKLEIRYLVLIVFMLIAIVLGFVNRSVSQSRELNFVESMIKDSVLFLNKIVSTPFNFINDSIIEEKNKKSMLKEYNDLKKEISKIESNNARILELETKLNELEILLDLNKSLIGYSYLNAMTINRNLGYWYNTITIDKGSKDGVLLDMAVIVNEGLIGKITEVTNFNSTVKLITNMDTHNKISVKIKEEDKDIYGILTNYNGEYFVVEGIDQNTTINPNSLVVTTGMGGIFPSGILIGKVKEISSDHFDLAKTVYVSSEVDFDNINYVTILKRNAS
jgi:rod shape-determining protein MreC